MGHKQATPPVRSLKFQLEPASQNTILFKRRTAPKDSERRQEVRPQSQQDTLDIFHMSIWEGKCTDNQIPSGPEEPVGGQKAQRSSSLWRNTGGLCFVLSVLLGYISEGKLESENTGEL